MSELAQGLEGMDYHPDFCAAAEADALLAWARGLDYDHTAYGPRLRGTAETLRRGYLQYGTAYAPSGARLAQAQAIPDILVPVIRRAQAASGQSFPASYCVVMQYPPGTGIGWHVDGNRFRDVLLVVSLGATAEIEYRPSGDEVPTARWRLAHGSLYAMHGPARWRYEHRVLPVPGERFCLQFRDVDPDAGRQPAGEHA